MVILFKHKCIILFFILITIVSSEKSECLCKLEGQIDDCLCTVDAIDYINNNKLYPMLDSLLKKDYFRYFKINLNRPCPFWHDDGQCASKDCSVKTCNEDQIPEGLKSQSKVSKRENESKLLNKYSKEAQELDDCDENHGGLGSLDNTISEENYEEFARWQNYDDAQDNFCELDDESSKELQYVDLTINPERFTGYKGKSAHRIWKSIYEENCFGLGGSLYYGPYTPPNNLQSMCLEKRVFYRAISGIHSSISLHLSSEYYFPPNGFLKPGYWGPNMNEFWKRFDRTGSGLHYLKNLYFLYLIELRALAKAAPLLSAEKFYTGNEEEDLSVRQGISNILKVASEFKHHFNETGMFTGDDSSKLKQEFKQHFRNITRIMDCVGCTKCQLWGKLQAQGLGTTFKILFFGNSPQLDPIEMKRKKFHLTRSEIVSLINGFGRLTNSIYQLEKFRQLSRTEGTK